VLPRGLRVAAAVAGCTWTAGAASAQSIPTNYELVRQTAERVCIQLVNGVGAHAAGGVALRSVSNAAGNFLVENAFTSALGQAGIPVRSKPDSSAPVLEFEVVDLGLAYVDTHRRMLIGGQKVEREARARVFARLVGSGGQGIVWADQASARTRDEVDRDLLSELEERNPPDYAKATLPPARWNKLVEPIVVSGIVVGLILLFFSTQSSD
jgi:hypothetical protein